MVPDDLPPLSPDALRLLSHEREAPGPSSEMMARVAARMDASLAAPSTVTTTAGGVSTTGGLTAMQWVTAAVVSAGLATAGLMAWRAPGGDVDPTATQRLYPSAASAPASSAAPNAVQNTASAVAAPHSVPMAVAPLPVSPPSSAERAVVVIEARGAESTSSRKIDRLPLEAALSAADDAPTTVPKRPLQRADLEGERRILSQARTALRAGDSAAALALIGEHRASHPGGALIEEREALRILALVARGDHDAATKAAQRFHARFKKSLHDGAIRAALGE